MHIHKSLYSNSGETKVPPPAGKILISYHLTKSNTSKYHKYLSTSPPQYPSHLTSSIPPLFKPRTRTS